MKRNILTTILVILCAVLAAELIFVGYQVATMDDGAASVLSTEPAQLQQPSQPPADPSESSTEPSTEATDPPTEPPTEPAQTSFRLTFTGDSTLGCSPDLFLNQYGFLKTVGDDFGFPYRNLAPWFADDDLTLINLEGVFADEGTGAEKLFTFRAPTEYVKVLTEGSVEAVTLANNHSMDFGTAGYDATKQALTGAGVTFVEQDSSVIYTTEGGLVVGLYAAAFTRNDDDMKQEIAALKAQGAQLIVAAIHWGNEGQYRATQQQKDWGHALIDAGVHIVWGHHPHTLQPIEEYNGGIIYYSMGNCSFGGNTWPLDPDTALVQQEVILSSDGTVALGSLTIVPCRVSSVDSGLNNFQPTPYAEGSAEYDRVMNKLNGTYYGPDLTVNYDHLQ